MSARKAPPPSETDRRAACGDGVAAPVAQWIAERLLIEIEPASSDAAITAGLAPEKERSRVTKFDEYVLDAREGSR